MIYRHRSSRVRSLRHLLTMVSLLFAAAPCLAGEAPLHARIDALIEQAAAGEPVAAIADDGEFLRRVYLDFTGAVPTASIARAFFADASPDKRVKLIRSLAADDRFSHRLADQFHVMLMEQRGEHAQWHSYLLDSFKANKPWDQLAREILHPDPRSEKTRASAFFYTKRLEKVGQQPVDYPGLTRDVGRLFLGIDLQCAQCHNHLTVEDYKQADFQGLFAFYQNIAIHGSAFPAITEKPTTAKIEFASVFTKMPMATGPRVPTLPREREIAIPMIEKGKEFSVPVNAKEKLPGVLSFSPLAELSKQLPTAENGAFARNIVNRLWFATMGRGLVDPLDLHHSGNPPSHPELLELLAREFVAQKFDVKWLTTELALTRTYQRSSNLPSETQPKVDRFTVALERRLSSEQLLRSVLTVTGDLERVTNLKADDKSDLPTYDDLYKTFNATFAAEPMEPQEQIDHTLKAALFMRNDAGFMAMLRPRPGNLLERLAREQDAEKLAEELFVSVLARMPVAQEKVEVAQFLASRSEQREEAVRDLVWALLTSAEFAVNH